MRWGGNRVDSGNGHARTAVVVVATVTLGAGVLAAVRLVSPSSDPNGHAGLAATNLRSAPELGPQANADALPMAGAVIPVGHEAVRVETMTYEPGMARTWAPAVGLHAVLVIAGELTAYDADGKRNTYSAGEAYIAGWDSYVSTNEGSSPSEIAVTYLRRIEGRAPSAPAPSW